MRWVIREGSTPKQGRYWTTADRGTWSKKRKGAYVWKFLRPETLAETLGGRVVRLR